MLHTLGFVLLSLVAVVSSFAVVINRNLFHAVLAFAVASLSVAGLMLTLNAEFLGITVILIYIGAVVVVAVFAVMLTGKFEKPVLPASNELTGMAAALALALILIISGVILLKPVGLAEPSATVSLTHLGELLLTDYVLPFELVSILLLAALIGAIVIAKGKDSEHAN